MATRDFWRATGRRIRRWLPFISAISTLLALIVPVYNLAFKEPEPIVLTDSTPLGTHKTVPLPDGSTLDLNSASRANIVFTSKQRAVTLESGEGVFDVKRDPRRPFIVAAGSLIIQVLGTKFDIREGVINPHSREKGTRVAVLAGTVSIAQSGSTSPQAPVSVSAGYEIEIPDDATKDRSLRLIAEPETRRMTAWEGGKIEIDNEPLSNVLAELSRYDPLLIDTTDQQLLNMPLTLTISTNNAASEFLQDMRRMCIQSKYIEPQHAILSRTPGKHPGGMCP